MIKKGSKSPAVLTNRFNIVINYSFIIILDIDRYFLIYCRQLLFIFYISLNFLIWILIIRLEIIRILLKFIQQQWDLRAIVNWPISNRVVSLIWQLLDFTFGNLKKNPGKSREISRWTDKYRDYILRQFCEGLRGFKFVYIFCSRPSYNLSYASDSQLYFPTVCPLKKLRMTKCKTKTWPHSLA